MEEIDIPSHFLCPISLQLMRDPVTVSTGITYDRESIEKWLFSCKNNTCPITKQVISDDVTPNHTLRRLIQAWCTLNASHGIELIPTPKPPINKIQIRKLLNDAKNGPNAQQKCLERIKSIAHGSERNKKCLEEAGAVEYLASILKVSDEALSLLYHLQSSEKALKKLVNEEGEFLDSLMHVLKYGNHQSRTHAIMLMKSSFEVADPCQLMSIRPEFFKEVVQILRDKISSKASKAALKVLVEVCPWGRNRIRAVESGAVLVLVELLIETMERRVCELILIALDQLCGRAEGRAELLNHRAGLAIVSKKIIRVSHLATDKAVRIISSVSRFSGTSRVLQEMLLVGVVSKLCLVLQVDASLKSKERTREMLRLHSRVWKNSSCIPAHLLSSYP